MRLLLILALVGLVGCDAVFGTRTPDGPADAAIDADGAPDAPACGVVDFGPDRMSAGTLGGGAPPYDPQISADYLELFFVSDQGTSWFNLRRATRGSTGEVFIDRGPISELFTPDHHHSDPALTANGRNLMFVRADQTEVDGTVYETTRGATGSFTPPAPAAGLSTTPVRSFDISADGLTILIESGGVMRLMTRADLTSAFELPTTIIAVPPNMRYPSFDGSWIYASNGASVFRFSWNGTTVTGAAVELDPGGEPDISADGNTLVYSMGGGIVIRTRCPI